MSKSLQNALFSNNSYKNKIINGDFSVNQRSETNSNFLQNNLYYIDRFKCNAANNDIILNYIRGNINGKEFLNYNSQLDDSELVLCNTPSNDITENLIPNGLQIHKYGNPIYSNIGIFGDAFNSTGNVNDNVLYVVNNGEFTNELSFGFWIRFVKSSFDVGNDAFFNLGRLVLELGLNPSSDLLYAYSKSGTSTWAWTKSNIKVNPNTWYYFSGSLNRANGTIKCYLNGSEFLNVNDADINAFGTDGSDPKVNNALTFGGRLETTSTHAINKNLLISHIRLFNRELNEFELKSLVFDSITEKLRDNGLVLLNIDRNASLKSNHTTVLKQPLEMQVIDDLLEDKIATLSFDFKTTKPGKYAVVIQDGHDLTNKKFYSFDVVNTDVNKYKFNIDLSSIKGSPTENGAGFILSILSYDPQIPFLDELAEITFKDYVYINNIQLEKGTEATEFEKLPYDIQLYRCMRYFEFSKMIFSFTRYGGPLTFESNSGVDFKVIKRTVPSMQYTTMMSNTSNITYNVTKYGFIIGMQKDNTYRYYKGYKADAEL